MRVLDAEAKRAVQAVIDANAAQLGRIPGFVSAEPGFPLVDGRFLKEPAVIVFVARKRSETRLLQEDRVPRQLDRYRVAVMQADPLRQVEHLLRGSVIADSVLESDSGLTYKPIDGNPIDGGPFKVSRAMLCHVGPDGGWPVLKSFIEGTERTISLAMYDFNAEYIAKTFIDTVRDKDLSVVLTWDDGMTAPETKIRKKLRDKLGERIDGWIVRCGSERRFASAYHEKVMVRDSKAFWLSSGNWSPRSQPEIDPIGDPSTAKGMYNKGNREWHVIVEDKALAQLFEQYIKHDRDASALEAEEEEGIELDASAIPRLPDLFVPIEELFDADDAADVPMPIAPQVLPQSVGQVEVIPVLTPDNYLGRIQALLRGAKRSIYLQYSYITYSDKEKDREFTELLASLAELSNRSDLDLRIIVGSNGAADKIRMLVQSGFSESAFRTQRNVHNKGIVVDGVKVLVSSANWSGDGVLRNRDAGVIIHDKDIAGYYEAAFLYDWDNRASSYIEDDPPVTIVAEGEDAPPGMVRMSWREYFG